MILVAFGHSTPIEDQGLIGALLAVPGSGFDPRGGAVAWPAPEASPHSVLIDADHRHRHKLRQQTVNAL